MRNAQRNSIAQKASADTRAAFARRYRVNFGGVFIAPARERLTAQRVARYKLTRARLAHDTRRNVMTTVYERRADFASDNLADHFGLAEQIEIGAGCLDRCDMMPTGGASQGFTFDQCAYVVMQ